jgi:alkanesulfonate monooxygenase SsuD/methylene tetrahydromethanopterin reductase-like flavin-dependent oxidoreductase (luciferase family)
MTFRHPALLARMAAAVDDLAGGRLVLGVGAGWNVAEHEAFGLPFPPVGQRMDELDEGIQLIKALWSGEKVSFTGKRFSLKDAEMHPTPAQKPRPPLLVGGSGEKRTLRIVAKYADEWNMGGTLPETYRGKTAILEGHCKAVGRDPGEISRSMMCAFIIGRGRDELRQRVEAIQQVLPVTATIPVDSLPEAMQKRGWLVGSPEQVVEQLWALAEAGVERVMLQHHNQTDDAVLELIAREIIPAVA